MTAVSQTKEYRQGFAAGRRRTEAELADVERHCRAMISRRADFWEHAFAICANLIVDGEWTLNGKRVSSMAERATLCGIFADAAETERAKRFGK